MVQKQMGEEAKAVKKVGARKKGSKSISKLREVGMNPDGDDETGDVEDAAAAKARLPEAVKERWKEIGGGDEPPDDDSSDGGKPGRKRIPPKKGTAREKGAGAGGKSADTGGKATEKKKGACAGISDVLNAMKKKVGRK